MKEWPTLKIAGNNKDIAKYPADRILTMFIKNMLKEDAKQTGCMKQTAQMEADRKYVLSLAKADGVPVNLDLADDRQYNFLANLRGGEDYLKTYFPQSFKVLQNTRQQALAEAKSNVLKAAPNRRTLQEKVAQGDDLSGWHDSIQIIGFVSQAAPNNTVKTSNTASQYQLSATGLVGFVDGLEEMNATLQIYNVNTGEIIANNSMENLLQNGYDTVITAAGLTENRDDDIEACLIVDYLPYDKAKKESKIVKTKILNRIDPSSPIQVDDPVHRAVVPNVGFMKICMGRHENDCDYKYAYQPSGQPPIPYVTVKGNVSFPGTITDPCKSMTTFGALFFVKRREGGATQFFADYADICKYFTVNGQNISWNFNPASFSKAPWSQGDEIDLNLTVQVSVDGKPKNGQFQITSLKGVPAGPSVAKIDVLRFVWGCLSADSLVIMENGAQKRIDSIKAGDMVRIDASENCRRVIEVVTGREDKDCLRITTENKHSVLVTDEHPIGTEKGFLPARELKTGDKIKTLSGLETIESIAKEQYDGIVYNLKLEGAAKEKISHYANDILVGDGDMQTIILEEEREAKKMVGIEDLPAVWQLDATNAERRQTGKILIPAKSFGALKE